MGLQTGSEKVRDAANQCGLAEPIRNVSDMPVFQQFYRRALEVEHVTRGVGSEFRWLRSQVLRSSESVAANMTEGFYSQYSTEYLQLLYRCRREARETLLHLNYAVDAAGLSQTTVSETLSRYDEALRQLGRPIASIERKIRERGKSKLPQVSGPRVPYVADTGLAWCLDRLPIPDDSSLPVPHLP